MHVLRRLETALAQAEGPLERDLLHWVRQATSDPSYLYQARSDTTFAYASLLLASLTNDGTFIEANYGGSLLPMRYESEDGLSLNYQLTLPKTYFRADQSYPLVLELPGLGWTNHRLAFQHVNQGSPYSQVINVIPIKANLGRWNLGQLSALLDHLEQILRIDPNRIYLLGHSVGGYAAWEWAKSEPDRFAAVAPCSTWGNPFQLEQLAAMPVLLMHGENDLIISSDFTVALVEKLRSLGGLPESKIFDGGGHYFIDAQIRTDMFCWLMEHNRADRWMTQGLFAQADSTSSDAESPQ